MSEQDLLNEVELWKGRCQSLQEEVQDLRKDLDWRQRALAVEAELEMARRAKVNVQPSAN